MITSASLSKWLCLRKLNNKALEATEPSQESNFPNEYAKNYQFKTAKKQEWEDLFSRIPQSNLLQAWCYGEAKSQADQWMLQRLILYKNDAPVALLQVLVKSFLGVAFIARINRGPLWLSEGPNNEDYYKVHNLIRVRYGWRNRSILLMAPNVEYSQKNTVVLRDCNYWPMSDQFYRSIWLDLTKSEGELRKALRGNWRNQLVKAEKSNLRWQRTAMIDGLNLLLDKYQAIQVRKGFSGLSSDLIKALAQNLSTSNTCQGWLFEAYIGSTLISLILMIRHGLACTYLIGWSDPVSGKGLNATNFLLWNTLLAMRHDGCQWLDLGGIAENTPELTAITAFKRGLSGEEYSLLGEHWAL